MIPRVLPLRAAVSALALAVAMPCGIALVVPAVAAQAQDASVSVAFRDSLAPHGSWATVSDYGRVWRPSHMPRDWRPYTRGHWEWTNDYGWYWHSDEPWGWITFHYGRWAWTDDDGWVWVPGTVWAPAWVVWRTDRGSGGPDYVGWAALPPENVSITVFERQPRYWVFVKPEQLVVGDISRVVLPPQQVRTVITRTVIVDRTVLVSNENRHIGFNRGIPTARLQVAIGHPIRTASVQPRFFDVQAQVREHHLDPAAVRAFDRHRQREVSVARDEGFVRQSRQAAEQHNQPINVQRWQQVREQHRDAWQANSNANNAGSAVQPGQGPNNVQNGRANGPNTGVSGRGNAPNGSRNAAGPNAVRPNGEAVRGERSNGPNASGNTAGPSEHRRNDNAAERNAGPNGGEPNASENAAGRRERHRSGAVGMRSEQANGPNATGNEAAPNERGRRGSVETKRERNAGREGDENAAGSGSRHRNGPAENRGGPGNAPNAGQNAAGAATERSSPRHRAGSDETRSERLGGASPSEKAADPAIHRQATPSETRSRQGSGTPGGMRANPSRHPAAGPDAERQDRGSDMGAPRAGERGGGSRTEAPRRHHPADGGAQPGEGPGRGN